MENERGGWIRYGRRKWGGVGETVTSSLWVGNGVRHGAGRMRHPHTRPTPLVLFPLDWSELLCTPPLNIHTHTRPHARTCSTRWMSLSSMCVSGTVLLMLMPPVLRFLK